VGIRKHKRQVSPQYAKHDVLAWSDIPVSHRSKYKAALAGTGGLAGAIKSKCASCVGFEDVTLRVGECTAYKCPLWSYRPYQERNKSE